jgi:methylthioribose-1-phosphate isomerase
MTSPIRWQGDVIELLDQRKLPGEEVWLACASAEDVARAIEGLAVRGAPAIGIAAAYGLALAMRDGPGGGAQPGSDVRSRFDAAARRLGATRPTAVNLAWALERGRRLFEAEAWSEPEAAAAGLRDLAQRLLCEQLEADRRMAEAGAELLAPGDRVLTHCNTGALATGGLGTAGGVIQAAWERGRLAMAWVDETRPLLQGARLTAWELGRAGVPFRLVTDSSVGLLMARGLVDRVIVGADRIAANGDVANKIGTYTIAVLAHRHGVPFYVAAPISTIDPGTPTGGDIPIERRDDAEVTMLAGTPVAPAGAPAENWAFDVTPSGLVAAIITERGVLEPPFDRAIAEVLAR